MRVRRRSISGLAVLAIFVALLASLRSASHVAAGASCGSLRAGDSRPPAAAADLIRLIGDAQVPAGQVVYRLRDSSGATMDGLDPIVDPAGGYLGVYHTQISPATAGAAPDYEVLLAHSPDLIHWQRRALLVGTGATMPTLRKVPDGPGYLLAYEQSTNTAGFHTVALRYYAGFTELLHAHPAATTILPREFSPYNDGTPAFLQIQWHGALARSVIVLSFHYEAEAAGNPGPDREAGGMLLGFRLWIAARDGALDTLLDRAGLVGSHGDERQFSYGGESWRVYEADPRGADFATWHIVLYRVATGQIYPLRIDTRTGSQACSFGVPIVSVLDPVGQRRRVLAVTMFVFSSGPAASEAGELLFYRRI